MAVVQEYERKSPKSIFSLHKSCDPEYWTNFLHRVATKVDYSNDCYIWTGTTRSGGGVIKWCHKGTSTNLYVYRIIAYLNFGNISDKQVNHKCDNRLCVNCEHLYTGNQSENVNDSVKRDRWHTKEYDDETIVEVRELYRDTNMSQSEIANNFNMGQDHVSRVVRGIARPSTGGPIKEEDY